MIRLPNNLPQSRRTIPDTATLRTVSKYYTGCRKSEALAIKRENIDFENKVIKIKNHVIHNGNQPVFEPVLKTESAEREIILLDRLYEILPRDFEGFLFSMDNDSKKPLTKRAFDVRLKDYCKRHNVNFTVHQLRHGFATMLYEAEVDEKQAQQLMGHADIKLTHDIYTHIRDEKMKNTADKLNNFNF